jgi:4-hydroxy-tetrahydrodipicolinate synthase
VLAGDDAYIAATILMGGAGTITAAAHVCTTSFVAMVSAALDGDVESATQLSNDLLPVVDAGSAEPNPALWKAALHATGEIAGSALRPPMTAASQEATDVLLKAIAQRCRSVAVRP